MAVTRDYLVAQGLPTYTERAATALEQAGADPNRIVNELKYRQSLFSDLFRNLVGRDPSDTEAGQMFDSVAPGQGLATHDAYTQSQLRDITGQFINDRFQRQAEEQARLELEGQKVEATRLSDLFRQQGNTTATTLEGQLQDFVQRTFEKVRPNLITSLQAQGLLNTGGLNQALSGSLQDLSSEAQDQVNQYRLGVEDQANQIKFGGEAAPYQFQQAQAMNRLPYLQSMGQSAIDRMFQQRLTDQNFQNQLALQTNAARLQRSMQPSFLRTMGQNFAASFGSNAAQLPFGAQSEKSSQLGQKLAIFG